MALQNATATGVQTRNLHGGRPPILRFTVPSGWHAPCSLPARGEAAAEETMKRKHKQLVSIWICLACEACNSASAEICLSCGKARPRRDALGLRRP